MKPAALHQSARGAIAVVFALMLAAVLAFIGLALDVAQAFNRKQELQQMADAVALAAAQSLDGTKSGVDDAVAKARTAAAEHHYAYGRTVTWSDSVLSFASSPDAASADWKDVSGAQAAPAGLRYARADASEFGAAGEVAMPFAAMLGAAYASLTVTANAVAGRSGIEVAPLAICAMSNVADTTRINAGGDSEWVHYGFRYGVTYNLLNLNPALGATTPEYFLVAPQAQSSDTSDAMVAPFMCSGSMQRDSITGATVTVRRPGAFTFSGQLNTRFDDFASATPCTPRGAPPDTNVLPYTSPAWMVAPVPATAHAQPGVTGSGKKLDTVADSATASAVTAVEYGTLWAYGPAKRAIDHAGIAIGQWPSLYKVTGGGSAPKAKTSYPSVSPYRSPASSMIQTPVRAGSNGRRLLYVPLLACPVTAGASAQAQVLAVARFLLAAPASAAAVSAEFAGVASEQALGGMVELYR